MITIETPFGYTIKTGAIKVGINSTDRNENIITNPLKTA